MEASVIHERQKLHNLLPYANLVPKNGSVVLVMWRELYFLVLNRKKEYELLCSSLVRPFSLTGRFVNKHSSPQLLEATDRWDDWLIRVARHTSSVRLCLVVDATTACPPARATQRNVNRTSLRDLLGVKPLVTWSSLEYDRTDTMSDTPLVSRLHTGTFSLTSCRVLNWTPQMT